MIRPSSVPAAANGQSESNGQSAPNGRPQSYGDAFPSSSRVFVPGPDGTGVPMREIALSGGEPPLRVYDTSGPRGLDPRDGLPLLRDEWIRARDVRVTGRAATVAPSRTDDPLELPPGMARTTRRGNGPVTQMHYARRGEVTPEMEFVAAREGMEPSFVRDEVARGRAIIPANINHPELEPMIIGRIHNIVLAILGCIV